MCGSLELLSPIEWKSLANIIGPIYSNWVRHKYGWRGASIEDEEANHFDYIQAIYENGGKFSITDHSSLNRILCTAYSLSLTDICANLGACRNICLATPHDFESFKKRIECEVYKIKLAQII